MNKGTSMAEQGHGARSQRRQASQTLMTPQDQARKPLETRPHRRERCPRGRGASASHWKVQVRMDSNEKKARDGTPDPRKKRAWPTAGRQRAISLTLKLQETSISRSTSPQTQCTQQVRGDAKVRRNANHPPSNAAHRRRQSRQCSKLGSSAFAVHRRGHRDPCLDAEAARIQKIVEIPLLQYTH